MVTAMGLSQVFCAFTGVLGCRGRKVLPSTVCLKEQACFRLSLFIQKLLLLS